MKKILIITISILIILAIGYGVYFFLNRNNTNGLVTDEENNFPSFPDTNTEPDTNINEDEEINTFNSGDFTDEYLSSISDQRLRRLSSKDLVSFYVYGQNDRGDTKINYIESSTGNIYRYDLRLDEEERISNKTILGIQNVIWGNEDNMVLQYLDDDGKTIQSFAGSLSEEEIIDQEIGTTTSLTFDGGFLTEGIESLSVSPNGNSVFYIKDRRGFSSSINNPNESQEIFSTKIAGWNSTWPTNNSVILSTKPSDGIPGYSYSINPTRSNSDSDLNKIIGPINSLSIIFGQNINNYIYSQSNSGTIQTFYNNNNGSGGLGFVTLAEKCVFAKKDPAIAYCAVPTQIPSAKYPDDWYKGRLSFSDSIFMVNVETGGVSIVYDIPENIGIDLDIIYPQTNEDDTAFVFIDKNTGNLWSLDLEDNQ